MRYKLAIALIILIVTLQPVNAGKNSDSEIKSLFDYAKIFFPILKRIELPKTQVFIDPNDDTKKKVILGVPETADYISVELDDPSSGHTQKYLALKNYYKDMKYEEVSDSFTATLTHGGRLTNDPAKGFIIDGKKLILDFLGCMSFLEEQCGLRINGPPVGQIQEGQEIQLTDKITLKIEELEGYGCDEEINICQGSPDLGYSRIKVKVMIRQ